MLIKGHFSFHLVANTKVLNATETVLPSISLIQFVLIVMNTLHPPSPLITPSNPQSWLCPKLLFITLGEREGWQLPPPPPTVLPNMSLHTKAKQRPPSAVRTSAGRSLPPHANVHLLLRFGGKVSSQGNTSGVNGSRARSAHACWCVLLYEECCSIREASALPRITFTRALLQQPAAHSLTRRHSERCRAHVRECRHQ